MVDKVDALLWHARYASQCHFQSFDRVCGVQSGPHTPSDNFLCVSVQYQRQIAEAIMFLIIPYGDIGDVADPNPVRCVWNKVLYQIRVNGESMCGIGRAGLTHPLPHLQPIFVHNALKTVATQGITSIEKAAVHVPQLGSTYTRVFLADVLYERNSKFFLGGIAQNGVLVILIIGLLSNAKQLAQTLDLIPGGVCAVQPFHCLAPAFFLIGMLKRSSATFIISL